MKPYNLLVFALLLFVDVACHKDEKIIKLLTSQDVEDNILGAYKAGETGKMKFVPYLLENAGDQSTSINIQFKGYSIYEEKMIALKKILES